MEKINELKKQLEELPELKESCIDINYGNKISITTSDGMFVWLVDTGHNLILRNITLPANYQRKGLCTKILKIMCTLCDDVIIETVLSDEMEKLCKKYNFILCDPVNNSYRAKFK